jgi:hypothetical protein
MGMLECRVKGWTMPEIAAEYRCSIDTVERHLEWAVREGQIQKHEETILERLIPKAITAYEKALDRDDVFVAKDLLGHLMKLSERVDARREHVEELSLTAWLKTRKRTESGGVRSPSAGDQDSADAAREDPLRVAGAGDGEVPGDAEAGPPEAGTVIDAECVPVVGPEPASADGESGFDAVDAEVVGSEDREA